MKEQGPIELVNTLLVEIPFPVILMPSRAVGSSSVIFSEHSPEGTIRIEVTHDTILATLIYHLRA